MLRLGGFIVGILVVVATLSSVYTTLVVPRATSSRLLRAISKGIGRFTDRAVRLLRTYEAKDRLMAFVGPSGMVCLFASWLSALVVGFGLMAWWSSGASIGHALLVAGSSVFTLGIATLHQRPAEALEVIASATGLLVVALEIAYLPTLYAAFSAREAEVTLLATRAGEPAWGPEILIRHHRFSSMAELADLYRTWESWAAAVAESHTSYPSLMWFRSPLAWRSWLTAMVAMLDAAALHDALDPVSAPRQARVCLQMGTHMLRSLAGAVHIGFDPDPLPTDPVRLTYGEYRFGIEQLRSAGFPFERTPEDAWPHFCGWRVNYEPIADALSLVIMSPPAPWSLPRPWVGEVRWPSVRNRTPEQPGA